MSKTNWLCLQSQTGKENEVAKALSSFGISSYAPSYRRRIVEDHRAYGRTQPLFPSYLFASKDYLDALADVRRLPLRLRSYVVGEIDCSVIEEIKEREEQGLVKLTERSCPYEKGDAVRINIGTMTGITAIFDSTLSGNERCIILVRMFDRDVAAPVLLSSISYAA